jgi:NAD(P)H dehydrogenase (quinone)
MKILTVYANPNPKSFCHAVLEQFTRGLEEAGHTNDVVDLYGINFSPVLTRRDFPNWIDEKIPVETLRRLMLVNSGGPIQRFVLERWLRNMDTHDIWKMVRRFRPKDVDSRRKSPRRMD